MARHRPRGAALINHLVGFDGSLVELYSWGEDAGRNELTNLLNGRFRRVLALMTVARGCHK